jgi:hypothetical protein
MNLGLEDLGSSGRELANIDSEGESPNTSFSVFFIHLIENGEPDNSREIETSWRGSLATGDALS